MKFGPMDSKEALEFAIEELRADVQYEVLRAMKQAGMSQADLARKLGVSQAWVSQMLGDDANLTVESLAKVFLALGGQCHFSARPLEAHFAQAFGDSSKDVHRNWQENVPSGPVDRRSELETTTRKLMQVIHSGCKDRRFVVFTNDNGYEIGERLAATA